MHGSRFKARVADSLLPVGNVLRAGAANAAPLHEKAEDHPRSQGAIVRQGRALLSQFTLRPILKKQSNQNPKNCSSCAPFRPRRCS